MLCNNWDKFNICWKVLACSLCIHVEQFLRREAIPQTTYIQLGVSDIFDGRANGEAKVLAYRYSFVYS